MGMGADLSEKHWQGPEPPTVAGLLREHAAQRPDASAFRFIGDSAEESWTYAELDRRARAVAARLQAHGLPGKTVLVLHPPGLAYIASFIGCLYAGAIAVPVYPPDMSRLERTARRLAAIARDARATHAISSSELCSLAESGGAALSDLGLGSLQWLAEDGPDGAEAADAWTDPGDDPGALAFLQYTSGSTASPKGVMVSNANLIHNLRSIHRQLRNDSASSVGVSWLPPYHDLGLIGGILTPVYGGFPCHLMAPLTFVRRPLLWLETISAVRATASAAPNFGYEHCVRKIRPQERDRLDLRSWSLALNGAEPVNAETLERFAQYFRPAGFDKRAFMPCYGLAEATLMVAGQRIDRDPTIAWFDSAALRAGRPESAARGGERTTALVGCGPVVDGARVAIVDPQTRRRAEPSEIGEIWVGGPAVATGYWANQDATAQTFGARIDGEDDTPYMRTGDLGFLRDGELFVVGRIKDVVIVQGRNYYPQDLEATAEKTDDAVRTGCGAAFGVELAGVEHLAIAYEVEPRRLTDPQALLAALRARITAEHEVTPHVIVLLRKSSAAKTTSGKIQRHACRRDFLALALPILAASVTQDPVPAAPDDPLEVGLPADRRRARIRQAASEAIAALAHTRDLSGRSFADLGLSYPDLVEAAQTLERRLGLRVPLGELLRRPTFDDLVDLLAGETPGTASSGTASSDTASSDTAEAPVVPTPAARTAPASGPQQRARSAAEIETWLTESVASRLGLSASTVDKDRPFADLGLSSVQAVEIIDEFGSWLGRSFSANEIFEHPTIRSVAASAAEQTALAAAPAAITARTESTAEPAAAHAHDEPIAIVGMACRLPGAPDVLSYWRMLLDGRDAVAEPPPERWDESADTAAAPRLAGFIDGVDEFDARFFGISAREAERMDPQQRLLLEAAWHAVEDSGTAPSDLAGSDTGVFIGISANDYSHLQLRDPHRIDLHAVTGSAHAVAANRLSYLLDLRGPSLALDTACSSSLVAVHMACQSLRNGECTLALAGGANLLIDPALSAAFLAGKMLAEDGRCRPFDDDAHGYVRGEGVGVVCLKPLSAALAHGDRIYAVIRGSSVGHGGRTNGLTAPKSTAQHSVIHHALTRARLTGADIDYVEAHGTGTILGDPVEWDALCAAYGRRRASAPPCLIGSVKSSIGHLEAAAGVAGLIKAALVAYHGQVPPQHAFEVPNRRLAWSNSGLAIATERQTLTAPGPVRTAVSSFGFGGTNAHVVLEAPTPRPEPVAHPRPVHALCLSAHTPTALATLAQRYRTLLAATPNPALADLCHTANTGRTHLAHRACVIADSPSALDARLETLLTGEAASAVCRGDTTARAAPTVAFLFSGQGTQYPGMGRALYETDPHVARSLERSDAILRPLIGTSLLDLLHRDDPAERLKRTEYSQPALVALEVALADLWSALGVQPAAVLGHSIGAYSAAIVAGVMSLEDGLSLAAARGRHMQAQPGDGAMIACIGDPEETDTIACDFPRLAVAAINAADHLVLSGPREDVEAARAALTARAVTVRDLAVGQAFHSPMMAAAAEPLRAAARAIGFAKPTVPWVSDATGDFVDYVDADDWVAHMLGTVRFGDALASLRRFGCDAFVEIGPHPTLIGLARNSARDNHRAALYLPSLRQAAGDWQTLLQSLGRLHCAGTAVRWAALDEGRHTTRLDVPSTVFERESYWLARSEVAKDRENGPASASATVVADQEPAAEGAAHETHPATASAPASIASLLAKPTVAGVRRFVLDAVARVSGFPVELISSQARLGLELGFDSLMKVELDRHITRHLPHQVDPLRAALPADPTVGQLVELMCTVTGLDPHPREAALKAPPSTPTPTAGTRAAEASSPDVSADPAPATAVTVSASASAVSADPAAAPSGRIEHWPEYAALQQRRTLVLSSGGNPYDRLHEGFNGAQATVKGQPVLNFASFNYLGLSHHSRVIHAAKAAIDRYGTSASATPLLLGETPLHRELETTIAGFLGTEAAIVFAGGHATNVATVGHLFGPEDLILHDEWIHDSTVRGSILSGALRRPFPHDDARALDRLLGIMRARHRRALIVLEGVYSQDGDLADLPAFIDVAKRHDAMVMIDEAHSIGVLGRTGRGIGEHFHVDRDDVDLWMGTLSKALGGLGGYIAARRPVIEYLRYTTPLYIFSTGITPANAAAAVEAIRVIDEEPERVERVRRLSELFRTAAASRGLDTGVSCQSSIVPIIIGAWDTTVALSQALLAQGVNVMPIGYPAVPADRCRLRFFINSDHTEAELEHALDLLTQTMPAVSTAGSQP